MVDVVVVVVVGVVIVVVVGVEVVVVDVVVVVVVVVVGVVVVDTVEVVLVGSLVESCLPLQRLLPLKATLVTLGSTSPLHSILKLRVRKVPAGAENHR